MPEVYGRSHGGVNSHEEPLLIVLTHKNVFSYISRHIERVLINISGSSPETGMKAVTGAEIEDMFRRSS